MSDNEILLPRISKQHPNKEQLFKPAASMASEAHANRITRDELPCFRTGSPISPVLKRVDNLPGLNRRRFGYSISVTENYPPFVGSIWTLDPKQLFSKQTPLRPPKSLTNLYNVATASIARRGVISPVDAHITNMPLASEFNSTHDYEAGRNWSFTIYYTLNI